jgi:multidrug efflux pump subunit AcrB
MNPINFALRHPVSVMMVVVSLIGGGGLAIFSMRVDIFPPFNLPQIYVIQNFNGMSPAQMEGLIVNQFELNFQYVDGVKEVESRSIQQIALIKLSFYPGTDMSQAMAEVVAQANRAQASTPPGTLPPQIMRMDAGSVPIGYLVLTSKKDSLGTLADLAQQRIRPLLQSQVPGTVGTAPFGSNARSIIIDADPDRLRDYNLTPEDLVKALANGNVILPSGNLYVKQEMPIVPSNATVTDIQEITRIPVQPGRDVYIGNVARVFDGTDVNFGYAMVDGRRSVYIPVVKKNTGSTLTVVSDIHAAMPTFKAVLPEGVDIRYEFDESPTVIEAIRSVSTEGLIGATLTGLMVLIFLHDWRSVLVVVFNIPMALLGSLIGLWITGNTINIMTLGGLALAIGILVDEATVAVENIHAQMEHTPSTSRAVFLGVNETAVARLLAMVCILSVFIPAFIMAEPVRSLFVPLSLAVGFAMISSYFLSSTVVPVLAIRLLKHRGSEQKGDKPKKKGGFDWFRDNVYTKVLQAGVNRRRFVVGGYVVACGVILAVVGLQLGTELFPQVDSGEFVLRFRMPPGTNYELTREAWVRALAIIQEEAGEENVQISMGFAGQQAPDYGLNNMLLFMRGPDDAQMRVALRQGRVPLSQLRDKLRQAVPDKLAFWFATRVEREGVTAEDARRLAKKITVAFEPGDLVSQVMSFGSPAPIEVVMVSPNLSKTDEYSRRILNELHKNTYLRDVQLQQTLDYPTVQVRVDRQKAGLSGLTVDELGRSVLVTTSSSRLIARNYWVDAKTGVSYQVQVQVPTQRMDSPAQLETVPLLPAAAGVNLLVRDVASVGKGATPGEFDRLASQRYLSVTANVEGEDLGRAARQVRLALADAGDPPRGVMVHTRGQVAPMNAMFRSLAAGLVIAVAVIYVLLTAYFQSPRLALVSLGAVPGVLSGVALALYLTRTTLNIESFMGTIMCIGVSVSNSVMLVTFTARDWREGKSIDDAAMSGGRERLRPILMTACAMTVGMVPMALALESGSQIEAPLARAVIGGLLLSTFATLLLLPAIFAVIMGKEAKYHSPSLHPNDPDSRHYAPDPDEGNKTRPLSAIEPAKTGV